MHATGIISKVLDHKIYLYYFGRRHAGENLGQLLQQRCVDHEVPTQMGDASSRNHKHEHDTHMSYCSAHATRKFKDLVDSYPIEAMWALALLKEVYTNDTQTKKMTDVWKSTKSTT